jgi:hypothetical protein
MKKLGFVRIWPSSKVCDWLCGALLPLVVLLATASHLCRHTDSLHLEQLEMDRNKIICLVRAIFRHTSALGLFSTPKLPANLTTRY